MPINLDPADTKNRTDADGDVGYVKCCQRGDAEAFAVLVRRHQKKMLNISFRIIGDYEEACDAVQEAFLHAYRAIGQFRGEARFSTWLCSIVLNHSRSHIRRRAARLRIETGFPGDSAETADRSTVNEPDSGGMSVVERLEKQELEAKVQECIGRLDAEQREVLVLRDIEGFSYEEIAGLLKLPEGTVKSRLYRARTALKDGLIRTLGDLR